MNRVQSVMCVSLLLAGCQSDETPDVMLEGGLDSAAPMSDGGDDTREGGSHDAAQEGGADAGDATKPFEAGSTSCGDAQSSADACVATACPQDCSGHGTCVGNSCSCAPGFVGSDCSACAPGWMASGASCVPKTSCDKDSCTPGAKQCNSAAQRACTLASDGCAHWSEWKTCTDRHCQCPFRDDQSISIQQWGSGMGLNGLHALAMGTGSTLLGAGTIGRTDATDMSAAFVGDLSEPPPSNAWWETWGGHYSAGYALSSQGGATFVAGSIDNGANAFGTAFLTKWTQPGERAWTATWDSPDTDEARSVAVAASGAVYVVGLTEGVLDTRSLGGTDAFLSRVSAAGAIQWTKQWGSPSTDGAFGVAVDPAGAVYVVGTIQNDAFCRKFSADGQEEWTTRWASAEYDVANAVALVADGVVVVGQAQADVGAAGNRGAFVSRVSATGATLWTQYFSAPNTKFDAATAVAVDAAGSIYVAGQSWGDLVASANAGNSDVFLQKRSSAGVALWTKQVGGAGTEEVSALVLGTDGIAYVGGRTTQALPGFPDWIKGSSFLIRVLP